MSLKMFNLSHLGGCSKQGKCKDEPHGDSLQGGDSAASAEGTSSFSSHQFELTGGGSRVQSGLTPTYVHRSAYMHSYYFPRSLLSLFQVRSCSLQFCQVISINCHAMFGHGNLYTQWENAVWNGMKSQRVCQQTLDELIKQLYFLYSSGGCLYHIRSKDNFGIFISDNN